MAEKRTAEAFGIWVRNLPVVHRDALRPLNARPAAASKDADPRYRPVALIDTFSKRLITLSVRKGRVRLRRDDAPTSGTHRARPLLDEVGATCFNTMKPLSIEELLDGDHRFPGPRL
jgi:hypothetical protein